MNQQNIYKVVLTGGPCAGKTTSLSRIKSYFENDFLIYIVPEIATLTIHSGVNIIPVNYSSSQHLELTKAICQMQLNIENYYLDIAKLQKKDVLLIFDRGVMDNFAYCSKENMDLILESSGWTLNYLCNDRYDMVIHIVTAAAGAEKYYSNETNANRYEDAEQAKLLDQRTLAQWTKHRNLKIIDNKYSSFNEKINKVLEEVSGLVKAPLATKIRKFLIEGEIDRKKLVEEFDALVFQDKINFLFGNYNVLCTSVVKRVFQNNPFPTYFSVTRQTTTETDVRVERQKGLVEKEYFLQLQHNNNNLKELNREVYQFISRSEKEYVRISVEITRVRD